MKLTARPAHEAYRSEIAYDYWTTRRALDAIGYDGPITVEWEDAGMGRPRGAPEALAHLRSLDFDPPARSFAAALIKQSEAGEGDRSHVIVATRARAAAARCAA